MNERDDDLKALRSLPARDVAPAEAARIGGAARVAFERAHEGGIGGRLALLWSRVGVPVMLAGVVFVYLGWTLQAAAALYR